MKQLTLAPLPYSYDFLEPVISKEIMELHHDKHQAAYVAQANAILSLETRNKDSMRSFSFNYNGAVLHQMFWGNMTRAKENNKVNGVLGDTINQEYGSLENFQKEFSEAAVGVEGSGWAVLWKTLNGLSIGQLEKHNLLGLNGAVPILVLDVWEHAYYLQYKNDRKTYVANWWQVVNWGNVEGRLLGQTSS